MAIDNCPGQDKRFWRPEDIFEAPCPHCGAAVEFWKDDPQRRCRQCSRFVRNPKIDLGCAKWCKYAKECLGVSALPEAEASLCDELLGEMKTVFGSDQRRIQHTLDVLLYAERILEAEGGDPLVVRAAAILHDIGIPQAERKHGSAAGNWQELEGPPIARQILLKLGVDAERTDHVCRIVGSHHSAGDLDTLEFRIIWDADRIANMPDETAGKGEAELKQYLEEAFRTDTGREIAEKLLGG
jgi:putative nucleotidyltransferase with HDIG domain